MSLNKSFFRGPGSGFYKKSSLAAGGKENKIKEENMNIMLIPLSVMFTLSLVGSVILFRFLKSSATIKKKSYQAGGAIAGFILIYGLLYASFNGMYKNEKSHEWEPQKWKIKGIILLQDGKVHDGISVKLRPEPPSTQSKVDGEFWLDDVEIFPNQLPNRLPDLDINSDNGIDNYYSIPVDLTSENVQIIPEEKEIILIPHVILPKKETGGE
jgi:hypothetical protein